MNVIIVNGMVDLLIMTYKVSDSTVVSSVAVVYSTILLLLIYPCDYVASNELW
jgi:hypothetical protein